MATGFINQAYLLRPLGKPGFKVGEHVHSLPQESDPPPPHHVCLSIWCSCLSFITSFNRLVSCGRLGAWSVRRPSWFRLRLGSQGSGIELLSDSILCLVRSQLRFSLSLPLPLLLHCTHSQINKLVFMEKRTKRTPLRDRKYNLWRGRNVYTSSI